MNACFVLFGSLGIDAYDADDTGASLYGGADDVGYEDVINPAQREGLHATIFGIDANIFAWGTVILGIFIGGVGGLSFKATTPQVAGIIAFAFIFWGAFVATQGILASLQLPDALILVLNVMHWWVFIAAIVQMATGTSFENMS